MPCDSRQNVTVDILQITPACQCTRLDNYTVQLLVVAAQKTEGVSKSDHTLMITLNLHWKMYVLSG